MRNRISAKLALLKPENLRYALHMRFFFLSIFLIFVSPEVLVAQSVTASFKGQTDDGELKVEGEVRVNVLTRKGRVTGLLSTGAVCQGQARLTKGVSQGQGTFTCVTGEEGRVDYVLKSVAPLRGTGRATFADGRGADLVIWR